MPPLIIELRKSDYSVSSGPTGPSKTVFEKGKFNKKVNMKISGLFIVGLAFGINYKILPIINRAVQEKQTVVIEVPQKQESFDKYLIDSAKAYGNDLCVVRAMVAQESEAAKSAIHAMRYEEGQLIRGKAAAVKIGLKGSIDFHEQARQFATSHCPMQVMGYHAAEVGDSWAVLHQPKECAEFGNRYFAKCRERNANPDKIKEYFKGLVCYNGSEAYARAVMNRCGQELLTEHFGNNK